LVENLLPPLQCHSLGERKFYKKIKNHCTSGQQVYWVCTLIEESEFLQNQTAEETYQLLVQNLASLNIGLIHGRMKTDQKETIMQQFKNAKLNILVSTTVIEVGVNVPNATLMVIEDADRLGLAQLHQLRGRVGRGQDQSYCALLFKAPLSDAGKQRLGIMRETTDGFIIAEKDLQIRGPGEYMGTRQTGQLQFKITNLETDETLIESCSKYKTTMMKQSQTTRNALIERWIVSSDELINA
jgi:ATP-dependent DNA helicase RecG